MISNAQQLVLHLLEEHVGVWDKQVVNKLEKLRYSSGIQSNTSQVTLLCFNGDGPLPGDRNSCVCGCRQPEDTFVKMPNVKSSHPHATFVRAFH